MKSFQKLAALLLLSSTLLSCASFNAFQKARTAEQQKEWDVAVAHYELALEIDPDNREYKIALDRARREASRAHFEKGKSLFTAAQGAAGEDQLRLLQLAATEFQLTVRLDPTNQFAAVEYTKAVELINRINQAASEQVTVEELKKRARANISKAQPPELNPASEDPISLTFSRDTPVKDIYRALGNAFGINVLFDQAIKDDRITIELRDVTAQQALERVMQAANHFYKVLDEKTIIVIPDNPQARRDYEDLVIRTFYLSNGDAEQVTNVVRTMTEARNIFPLKALNAITIRDTADRVRIAEKIIEANDKAKAEVVVQVELVQLDLNRIRDIGMAISGFANADGSQSGSASATPRAPGATAPFTGGTLDDIAGVVGSINDLRRNVSFAIPTAPYSLMKTFGNSELLANPELRISEGEKATLHIGQRIPVPVTTVAAYNPVVNNPQQPNNNQINPYGTTSFQYQDVGIKVAMEPRVHHNREVTLKLTVEVSNQGTPVTFAGQEQPTFATRTIESTIRLKDGETNFLAGLIQTNKVTSQTKTPFLGDIPFIGRLFTNESRDETRTDLVLTMTPHIIRIPDITEEDLAPMWVGTGTNLTFRGVSPRIESQAGNGDPFTAGRSQQQFNNGTGAASDAPLTPGTNVTPPGSGSGPTNPFNRTPPPPPPPGNNPPEVEDRIIGGNPANRRPPTSNASQSLFEATIDPSTAELRIAPRLAPQPATIQLGAGESRLWSVIGMDLDGLGAAELALRFDPTAITVTDVTLGRALAVDAASPPAVTVDSNNGIIMIRNLDGAPLRFNGGGEIISIRVHGGGSGETFLVVNNPDFRDASGRQISASVAGGRAVVE